MRNRQRETKSLLQKGKPGNHADHGNQGCNNGIPRQIVELGKRLLWFVTQTAKHLCALLKVVCAAVCTSHNLTRGGRLPRQPLGSQSL